jgi:ribosomal protein S18 acetylase RimI-like enzyme
MNCEIREMIIEDYDSVRKLWDETEYICTSASDSREGIAVYLDRNLGLCFVGIIDGEIIATVLCGHDGRRGYLTHLAVASAHRQKGIARDLVGHCVEKLRSLGIIGCNLFILDENKPGIRFWEKLGWRAPDDWGVMSRRLSD